VPRSTPSLSRRDFLASLIPGRRAAVLDRATLRPAAIVPPPPAATVATLAIIAGRHCLACEGSFCSTCRERCPVAGAIVTERGLPRIDPMRCNGCRICHEVCPAPTNAIRLIPRPASGPLAATTLAPQLALSNSKP